MKPFLTILLFGLGSMASQAAVITTQSAVDLNQSFTDTLNGITPTTSVALVGETTPTNATFTNATTATSPNDAAPSPNTNWYLGNAASATVTFDLGTGVAAADRRLDSFVIWIADGDGSRNSFDGKLAISLNGTTFTDIPGTATTFDGGGATASKQNAITFTFSANEVANFRYIRLTSNDPAGSDLQPRFVETDGFVSLVPEPSTWALLAFSLTAVMVFRRRRVA